ncbi:Protein of unknown function DUF1127 [Rhabdaerophilaceae bacterium]
MAFFPGTLLSLCFGAATRLKAIVKMAQNRRQMHELSHWSVHALKDIGLTHSDLVGALSLPLHRDPTEHLADLSGRSPRSLGEKTVRRMTPQTDGHSAQQPGCSPSTRPALQT